MDRVRPIRKSAAVRHCERTDPALPGGVAAAADTRLGSRGDPGGEMIRANRDHGSNSLYGYQIRVLRYKGKVAIPMPDRDTILDRNRRDQAVGRRTDRISSSSSLGVNLRRCQKDIERQRVAQTGNCEKSR